MKELLSKMCVPLDMLKSHTALGPISTQITPEENKSGWKKRRLASAEASGPSMDHHVAGCKDSVLNEIDTLMRELPCQHGFSPDSWQTITDVEMLKKAGVYDVEKMRTVQLMHSAFITLVTGNSGAGPLCLRENHCACRKFWCLPHLPLALSSTNSPCRAL
jgi:hypothetical protein